MDEQLYTLNINSLDSLDAELKQQALTSMESGKVIYLPSYCFQLSTSEEKDLISDNILDGKHKNISYDYGKQRLGGYNTKSINPQLKSQLETLMLGYAEYSKQLITNLFPGYAEELIWGRTSYRPAEIKNRTSSKRKDDTRLHVDSFPATPVNGRRILRVFCNINPYGEPRVWNLGEPFGEVLSQFHPTIPAYNSLTAKILHWIKATKTLRSAYDHYQLKLHDTMKLSDNYQKNVSKHCVHFPAGSTWIVFTDQTSHAALSGQFLLEQTFYLPVHAMAKPELSPMKQWEQLVSI